MKKFGLNWKDSVISLAILTTTFLLCLLLHKFESFYGLTGMMLVLSVFLISVFTQGYICGIAASLLAVLIDNFAFTFPFFAFDFLTIENLISAIVMLIVVVMTCTLTTKIKIQQTIKAEVEKEIMRANLLRAVSHDLRTPLTSIYGATSAIADNFDSLTPEQHMELLRDVQEDAQWLIRMVENLLSVTRIDGQKVKLTKMPTVLEELIDTVLVKFKKRCPEQPVLVEIPESFVSIPMDAMLIEQVLINILENAVDHAKGMKDLELRVTCENGLARFSVSDDGCGIPQERMEELFTGYLDRKTTPADGSRRNMGIGLSVCATIIKAHGGEIHARNRESGGAEFYFCLKMEDGNEQ